jgi:hypothetical protein
MVERAPLCGSLGRGLRLAALIATSLAALAVAVPAQAKPLEKERFSKSIRSPNQTLLHARIVRYSS